MAKILMLTALAGEGIDVIPGDALECSAAQATRFLAVGYAREFDPKLDKDATVKALPDPAAKPDAEPDASAADEPQPSGEPEPPAAKPTPKTRKRKPKDGQAQ